MKYSTQTTRFKNLILLPSSLFLPDTTQLSFYIHRAKLNSLKEGDILAPFKSVEVLPLALEDLTF